MRLKFNPYRAVLVLLAAGGYLAWKWAHNYHLSGRLTVWPALDQTHTIAALAIVGITVVGLYKLWLRR